MKSEEAEQVRIGSLKGGYNRIARDFDRALHLARLSSSQLFLIQQAREMSWTRAQIDGAAESYPFRLNVSEVARHARADRKGIHRQLGKLFAARILLDLGDGRNLINRDYRTWIDEEGRPLLAPDQLRWCLEVRRRKSKGGDHRPQGGGDSSPQAGFAGVGTPVPRPVDSSPHPLGTPVPRPVDSSPQARKSGLGTPVPTSDPSPRTPIYEARAHAIAGTPAELRVPEERRRDPEETPSGGCGGDEAPDRESDHEPFTAPVDPPPAPGAEPAELVELLAWVAERIARSYPNDESLLDIAAFYAREWHAEKYTPAEVRHGLLTAITAEVPARSLTNYARSVLLGARRRAGRPGQSVRADAPQEPPTPKVSPAQAQREAQREAWRLWDERRKKEAEHGPA